MATQDEGHGAGCDLAPERGPGQCHWCGGRLPARRTRFCSDHCGALWAENHVWARAKEAAKERAGYHCERCGAAPLGGLDVHHAVEVDPKHGYETGCQHHQAGLEVCCPGCHRDEHAFRREVDGLAARQLVLPLR